jgi:hypothetical protein
MGGVQHLAEIAGGGPVIPAQVAVLTSTSAGASSSAYELHGSGRSAFGYYFARALKEDWACSDSSARDGILTLEEINEYLKDRLQLASDKGAVDALMIPRMLARDKDALLAYRADKYVEPGFRKLISNLLIQPQADQVAMGGCGLREPRNPCSPLSRDDGPGRAQDGSFRKGCTARRCIGRVSAQAKAGWSVQSRNRLGVCLADDERQATALARNPLATIRATGSEGGEDPEAGRVPHLPAHVHNFADSEQRGSKGGTGAPTSCEQSHYAGSLRSGGNAEQTAGTKQTGSDGAQQGRGTGLTGP